MEEVDKNVRVDSAVYDFLLKQEKEFVRSFIDWCKKSKGKTLLKTYSVNNPYRPVISYAVDIGWEDLQEYEKKVLSKK